jgi:hypothetical protein
LEIILPRSEIFFSGADIPVCTFSPPAHGFAGESIRGKRLNKAECQWGYPPFTLRFHLSVLILCRANPTWNGAPRRFIAAGKRRGAPFYIRIALELLHSISIIQILVIL